MENDAYKKCALGRCPNLRFQLRSIFLLIMSAKRFTVKSLSCIYCVGLLIYGVMLFFVFCFSFKGFLHAVISSLNH